jgi:NAD/NADP transhydrogenase alpha subunit
MTTTSINHRPAPFLAAAAAVAVIAAGSVALSLSHHASTSDQQPQPTSVVHAQRAHHFHPTTSGGRVMLGQ